MVTELSPSVLVRRSRACPAATHDRLLAQALSDPAWFSKVARAAARRAALSSCVGSSHDDLSVVGNGPKSPEPVNAQSVPAVTSRDLLTIC
jgi:hypothetical protein